MKCLKIPGAALLLAALPLKLKAATLCTTTALSLGFGGYNPFSTAPLDSTGEVSVSCTGEVISALVNYTIRLSAGSSGGFTTRYMVQGANHLNYNLYTNSSHSIVWGDGASGTSSVTDSYSLGLLTITRNYPVYGRVPAQQNVMPGLYADTIVVTVDY